MRARISFCFFLLTYFARVLVPIARTRSDRSCFSAHGSFRSCVRSVRVVIVLLACLFCSRARFIVWWSFCCLACSFRSRDRFDYVLILLACSFCSCGGRSAHVLVPFECLFCSGVRFARVFIPITCTFPLACPFRPRARFARVLNLVAWSSALVFIPLVLVFSVYSI